MILCKEAFSVEKTIRYGVGSVSRAIQGQKVLQRNGFRAFVHRASGKAAGGCGHTLWVTAENEFRRAQAERLLTASGIRFTVMGEGV